MPKINVLNKEIAELIAAGEVVERPASVIKELVENSIDAGAKNICIEIKNGGISFMRVTDDGCAIQREDVKNAFLRHATSKIKDATDLDKISTLGFRGEALASIAAVSKVQIITRTKDEIAGTSYNIAGSVEGELTDIGCPVGTTLIIKDLFFNTPARMKFLKKDVSESNAVAGIIDKIALSHPEISFKFIRDNKECLNTLGDSNIKSAVYSVYGKDFCNGLAPVDYTFNNIKVHGFINRPEFARANRSMQNFFINGRYVKSKTAMVALEQAFKGSIMSNKFPSCVLYIDIPCETTDVNVHPSKLEIRFIDERPVFDAVYYAVKNAESLCNKKIEMSINNNLTDNNKAPKIISENKVYSNVKEKPIRNLNSSVFYNDNENKIIDNNKSDNKAIDGDLEVFVPKKSNYSNQRLNDVITNDSFVDKFIINEKPPIKKDESQEPTIITQDTQSTEHKQINKPEVNNIQTDDIKTDTIYHEPKKENIEYNQSLYDNKISTDIIGEAFNTYIIIQQDKDTLLFIDKHAAHERLTYEKLKANSKSPSSQILLTPITVTLEKNEYSEILNNKNILSKAGFELDDFGSGTVIVRAIPIYLSGTNIEDAIIEIAGHFVYNRKDVETDYTRWLYHNIACRSSVKAGDKISREEIVSLVEELSKNPEVRHCPHGRPIFFELKRKEIEKQFCRT